MWFRILLNFQQWGSQSVLFYWGQGADSVISLALPDPPPPRPLAHCSSELSDLILHKCLIRLQRLNTIRSVAHKLTNPLTLQQRNNSRARASQTRIRKQLAKGTICLKNYTAVSPHTYVRMLDALYILEQQKVQVDQRIVLFPLWVSGSGE